MEAAKTAFARPGKKLDASTRANILRKAADYHGAKKTRTKRLDLFRSG